MAEEASSRVPIHLPTYNLGDEGKPNHLNASTSRETAADEAKSLTVGDAAFIKRSDLKWTYAVVTEKIEGDSTVLRFEVDQDKNRKSFPETQWGKYIRVIHVEESELAILQTEANKMNLPPSTTSCGGQTEANKVKLPSSGASIGGESTVSVKTGKSFFSGIFASPKKVGKKESKTEDGGIKGDEAKATEVKEDEAKATGENALEETKGAEDAALEETKVIEEVEPEESKLEEAAFSRVASDGAESTSNKKSKSVFNILPSMMKPKSAGAKEDAKSTADLAEGQPVVVVATLATPEDTGPEAPENEPDNTKENFAPVEEAPKDTLSPLGGPFNLMSNFSPKKNSSSSQASVKSNKSILNKLGLKTVKKTPPKPTETKLLFEHSKNTNTVNELGDTNPVSSPKAGDITKKEWFDAEACEVDYDKNPTDLFQALEAREFVYADSMYKQVSTRFSKECKTWVVAHGQKQDRLRFRALPLHAALVFGAPDELVIKILNAYPLATRGRDIKGRLPIHLAMEHNVSEEVVTLIIEAFPKGMFATDKKKMAALDYINGNMGRVHMKKYLPLIIAAKVEEERAKWEVELATAIEELKVTLKSDPEFMKPIVEAVTEEVENTYAGKLTLVETSYQQEIESMKKKYDGETQALLDGFEVKMNFERKMQEKLKADEQ